MVSGRREGKEEDEGEVGEEVVESGTHMGFVCRETLARGKGTQKEGQARKKKLNPTLTNKIKGQS